jgi:hypothetical protein
MIVGFIVNAHTTCYKLLPYTDPAIKIYSTPVKALAAHFTSNDDYEFDFEAMLHKNNNNVSETVLDCLFRICERGGVTTPPDASECTESTRLVGFKDGSTLNVIPVIVEDDGVTDTVKKEKDG